MLAESGLTQFYELSKHPGVRVRETSRKAQWAYLDEPALQQSLLDFTDGNISRVTFNIPTIHCIACVWLLENLFRLHPGFGQSLVNFPRRELSLSFSPKKTALSEVVSLLASIGYEPRLTLSEMEKRKADPARKRQWLKLGVAGFAFGNIMLFSLPSYLGLDTFSAPLFKALFGYLCLALALPVVTYSAGDYWRSALLSLRQRVLTLDVPIAIGLVALYAQSAFELVSGRGLGYLDSLAGLVFFLLCGRAFQQKTHERIAFDRDYKCFFPLSVVRKTDAGEETIALVNLGVGDHLLIRNGELIPADARLVSGPALIDYSFVTGESSPLAKSQGDYLYAGGKQVGGSIELQTVKPVSQSYLTSLWNHEAFHKEREHSLDTLTNQYGRRFTRLVLVVALVAALFWIFSGNASRALKAFTSVLIVACPCALALAAPFTLGTAQRLLGRLQVFLKNALVLERMARVDTIVFDKTGTLTDATQTEVTFVSASSSSSSFSFSPGPSNHIESKRKDEEEDNLSYHPWTALVCALARQSTHPHSQQLANWLSHRGGDVPSPRAGLQATEPPALCNIEDFVEVPGCGIEGKVDGHRVRIGSRSWFENLGASIPELPLPPGSVVCVSIDGHVPGAFVLANAIRAETAGVLRELGERYKLALLSGDNEKERPRFRALFGSGARLLFNQSPTGKLAFIQNLQRSGKVVMMVGDGLNDAGALKHADIGVAVVEKIGAFSPASDVILAGDKVRSLPQLLKLARISVRIVRLSFVISALYNLVGISIAAVGILSPLICAVLMPLSSISVVAFACGTTSFAARRLAGGDKETEKRRPKKAAPFELRIPHSALRT